MRWDFLYDRDLLSDLSRCPWDSLKLFLRETVPERNPIPGVFIAIQTFGDFLGFNPHCHVLVTEGCFYGRGMFRGAPCLDLKKLEAIFRHKVFRMLLAKGRVTKDLIVMLSNWRHSGLQLFCGQCKFPQDKKTMEDLAGTSCSLPSAKNGCRIQQDAEKFQFNVTPAKAGVQTTLKILDSCFRRNDDIKVKRTFSANC